MDIIIDIILDYVLGNELEHIIVQYTFLLILSLAMMIWVIKNRIGSLEAVVVRSYPRLCMGVLICSLVGLISYRLLLLINPIESQSRLLYYVLAAILTYPIYGIIVSIPSYLFDGGKALQVITPRYKTADYPKHFVDLTKEQGKYAQVISRGAIRAYQVLIFLSWFVIFFELKYG